MAKAELGDAFDLLDWFVGGLDRVLGAVGVTLSPFELQLALAIAAVVIAVPFAWRLPAEPQNVKRWLGVAAMALITVFISWRWAQYAVDPDPDFVNGEIVADSYQGMLVELLGFRGEVFAPGEDSVASNGIFAFHYERQIGDWPRRIRVWRPGCAPQFLDLSRQALRARVAFRFEFNCSEVQ